MCDGWPLGSDSNVLSGLVLPFDGWPLGKSCLSFRFSTSVWNGWQLGSGSCLHYWVGQKCYSSIACVPMSSLTPEIMFIVGVQNDSLTYRRLLRIPEVSINRGLRGFQCVAEFLLFSLGKGPTVMLAVKESGAALRSINEDFITCGEQSMLIRDSLWLRNLGHMSPKVTHMGVSGQTKSSDVRGCKRQRCDQFLPEMHKWPVLLMA